MQMAQPEHNVMVEQQLFDVHAHVNVKRAELELVVAQLASARHDLEQTGSRVALAETPLAQREHSVARRRLHDLEKRHLETAQELDRLLSTQDALLAKLVG
jgi:hypothetical protein